MPYFVTDDNNRIYYEDRGNGEPLIFIHGWTCNRHFFKYQVPEFIKNYRVITYDLRGHGDSDRSERTENGMSLNRFATDLYQLIEYLDLKNVNLCGWSMGTSTLLNYVRLFGCDNIKSMCFIDMTPKLLTDDEWKLGQACDFDIHANLEFSEVVSNNWSEACKLFIPNVFCKGYDQNSDTFKWTMQQALNNTPHCMLAMWIAMAVNDYRDVLSKISVPVFLAYSGDGLLYSPEHGKYMKDHIPNATLDIFPGCGHGLFLENPEKFNADYKTFLKNL